MNALPKKQSEAFDVMRYRADFPVLAREVHGKPLIYFDNANTSQKPLVVIDAVDRFYRESNANVARAVHQLGEEATAAYEAARDTLARFVNAASRDEVILTSGTTQATNLVAYSYALPILKPGDEILVTTMEHHANIVPWQLVAERAGAKVIAAPITERGELIVEEFVKLLTPRVKLAGVAHVSNVLGTINPDPRIGESLPRARHSVARRRFAGRSAFADRRAVARLRFLRADRPQDFWSDRHRACSGRGRKSCRPCRRFSVAAR